MHTKHGLITKGKGGPATTSPNFGLAQKHIRSQKFGRGHELSDINQSSNTKWSLATKRQPRTTKRRKNPFKPVTAFPSSGSFCLLELSVVVYFQTTQLCNDIC